MWWERPFLVVSFPCPAVFPFRVSPPKILTKNVEWSAWLRTCDICPD